MITQHIIIGAAPLVACSKDTPDVDDIVNRFSPNGGVIRPQIITIHINTPRWSSLSPNSTPIGTRIGAVSYTHLDVYKRQTINYKNSILLFVALRFRIKGKIELVKSAKQRVPQTRYPLLCAVARY